LGGFREKEDRATELQEVVGMVDTRKMSRAEAGRKGGQTTKQRYGEDFFGKIGRMGGKKGGETTKRRYGIEFYQKIGRKGGSR
jgi:general stress protein YciG